METQVVPPPEATTDLKELRRKAALTDRLLVEVLRHRARSIWDQSYSTSLDQAEERARASMVREGLLPARREEQQ